MSSFRPAHGKGPLAWMARNHVAANVLMFIILVGGVLTLKTGIRQEVFPEIELDKVMIQVPYPGASPAEVEQGVILAIEEAIRGIEGIKEVRSTAVEGNGIVAVDILLGEDPDRVLSDVKSAVDRITSFPEDAERPVVALAISRRHVISLVLYGDVDEEALFEVVEQSRQQLLDDPDISYVELAGLRPLEISVEISQENLRRYGLTLEGVAQAIRQSSVELPAGGVKTSGGEILLRTAERRDRGADFGEIPVLSRPDGTRVLLRDIADIRDGFQELDQASWFDGRRAAMINVYGVGDETPISVSDAVKRYVEQHRERLAPEISLATWNDRSELYRARVDLLTRNAMFGLVLVLISLGLFLEPRLAFWVTLGIPISFAGALLLFPMADATINMISLFAFIVTLGMVVDDAIVVGEAVYEKRQRGMVGLEAAITGVREVAVPVVFSVLTTCIAFTPLFFVPGLLGKFFNVIPFIVISVLLVSLVESLFILPAHLSHPMPWWLRTLLWPVLGSLALLQPAKVERGLGRFIQGIYRPFLGKALTWRYTTVAVATATLVGTLGFVAGGHLPFTFMPKIEGDVVSVSLEMPVGTSAAETRRILDRMVETAQATLGETDAGMNISRGVYAQLGSSGTDMGGPRQEAGGAGSHLASVQVYLVEIDRRNVRTEEFARIWRAKLGEVAGADSLAFHYSIGASAGRPIDVQLSHPDAEVLEAAALRLAEQLRGYEGLLDIDSGVNPGKEQIDFTLTAQGRARGLTASDLARQVRSAFFGAEALRQQRGRHEVRVYVRRPKSERESLHHLEQLVLRTPTGGEMPLGQAADMRRGRAYTEITRVDGLRIVSVTADVDTSTGTNANTVVQSLQARELPSLVEDVEGLRYAMGGEQKEQAEALEALRNGFRMALIAMFGMMAIVFRSFAQPLLVLLAIPFGIVGAIWGHLMMGMGMSLMSMMGVVAVSGVVVNDAIVLVDAVNDFRASGMTAAEAVVAAGTRRFRAILLTSLTTFVGLAPMVLETSVQARFLVPMAISLSFGVLFSTAITLLVVPSTYLIMEDAKSGSAKLKAWVARAASSVGLSPAEDEPEEGEEEPPSSGALAAPLSEEE